MFRDLLENEFRFELMNLIIFEYISLIDEYFIVISNIFLGFSSQPKEIFRQSLQRFQNYPNARHFRKNVTKLSQIINFFNNYFDL